MLKYIACILAGAIITILLMRSCNTPAPIDTTKIDSLYKAIEKSKLQHQIDSIEYIQDRHANDSIRMAELATKEMYEQRLANKISQLTFQVAKYRTGREGRDTVQALTACDSIISLLDTAYQQALAYKITIDSLQTNGYDRRFLDSTAIHGLNDMVAERDKQIEALQHFLNDAVKDNADLRTALTKSKRGKWLLAGIGVLVGAVGVGLIK